MVVLAQGLHSGQEHQSVLAYGIRTNNNIFYIHPILIWDRMRGSIVLNMQIDTFL